MRAAIYIRVSTEEQAQDGTSLATQRERCEGYVTSRGWSLELVEFDEGVSGTCDSRPGLDRLMAQCRSGQIDVLVVRSEVVPLLVAILRDSGEAIAERLPLVTVDLGARAWEHLIASRLGPAFLAARRSAVPSPAAFAADGELVGAADA